MVDPAGQDGRNTCQRQRLAAEEIGTTAAVAMHDIRSFPAGKFSKLPCEAQVVIAGTVQVMDRDRCTSGDFIDGGIRWAHQQILDIACRQPFDQPDHLLGATIEMTPGLDVQNLHRVTAIDFTKGRG